MNLLTTAQIADATEGDLIRCLRAVSARLRELNEQRALRTAREVLIEHEQQPDLRLRIGVDEWEDGYYYAGVETVEDVAGHTMPLPPRVIESLDRALQEPLTELVYAGDPLGRFATATLDLARNAVTYSVPGPRC